MPQPHASQFVVPPEAAGQRLDQFLASHFAETSRSRIQMLISEQKVMVNEVAAKPSMRLKGGEVVQILGKVQPPPLRAMAEDIYLDIVFEDDDLAVINKPAGMMVHAGAGATEDSRNRGTLVNALLYRFGNLSNLGGEMRPGIVHRLDKSTSGLIVVAKNDATHQALAKLFSQREITKTYLTLVHGWPEQGQQTIAASISRDQVRRIRMTTRGYGGRPAITHFTVQRKINSRFGKFAFLEVKIDTGRTHQIRVHLASLGHPVVGDALYGAPREIRAQEESISLPRNFLHAAALQFKHPRTAEMISLSRPLPGELLEFMQQLETI